MRSNTNRGTIRRQALEKLALLSAQYPTTPSTAPDIPRLCSLYRRPNDEGRDNATPKKGANGVLRTPMGARELDVLVALCRAAPAVTSLEHAQRLLDQILPYLLESHSQSFRSSHLLRDLEYSPWHLLAKEVTSAVSAIAIHHSSLRASALSGIERAAKSYSDHGRSIAHSNHSLSSEDAAIAERVGVLTFSLSLLGFLEGLSVWPAACDTNQRISLVFELQALQSEKFMVAIEGTLSSIRNSRGPAARPWKRLLRQYAADTHPLGAMLLQHTFMAYVAAATALMLLPPAIVGAGSVLAYLAKNPELSPTVEPVDDASVERLAGLIADSVALVDADADYLQVSSAWQQQLAFSTKADTLTSYLCCLLKNDDAVDAELLTSWLDGVLTDPVQLADDTLASAALRCMVVLATQSSSYASTLSRALPKLIVQGKMTAATADVAAESLASALSLVPQDLIISTLYSLGNILSIGPRAKTNMSVFFDGNGSVHGNSEPYGTANGATSTLSLVIDDAEQTIVVHGAVVRAIVAIARRCNDEKITALAISMMVQKIGRATSAVDAKIIVGSAAVALHAGINEFRPLLKMYSRVASDALGQANSLISAAVMEARLYLARNISQNSALFEPYLMSLLDGVVSTHDTAGKDTGVRMNDQLAVSHISQLVPPLAAITSANPMNPESLENRDALRSLTRDAWFNLIVHDFVLGSPREKACHADLRTVAWFTPPLIDMDFADTQESGIDLNTVLRRGMSHQHTLQLKSQLISALPAYENDIKGLDYAELIFLHAANLVAILRTQSGDCTRTMTYFLDPKFKSGPLSNCLLGVALHAVDAYLSITKAGHNQSFAAPELANQLSRFFEGCCHRIGKVQQVAMAAADRIISQIPSALCHRTSLFAMLELLSLMWTACLEAETNEYEWKSEYKSAKGNVTIQLSDDFALRQFILRTFQQRCRVWISRVMDIAPLDLKGLLQTYLSDYEDDGAYGHVSLGRSFALEIGSIIPATDQRLGAIGRHSDLSINTASDFVAQYTTRQEYRYADIFSSQTVDDLRYSSSDKMALAKYTLDGQAREIAIILRDFDRKLRGHHHVSGDEIRSYLRRAASILCNVDADRYRLINLLVGVPFTQFTKQSIKFGISLWMGVIKENSKLESRILAEVLSSWEMTIRRRRGIFSRTFHHLDPFFVKEEFAPSDRTVIAKKQQIVHDAIAPHFRLIQFLSSHFNATRLSSPHIERIFIRTMRITMASMNKIAAHPLAREAHFHMVLLGLRVLANCTGSTERSKWQLKDQVLSAGLSWFKHAPMWSYGSNKLQIKAEVQLISDVLVALQQTSNIVGKPAAPLQPLNLKQELLAYLLTNEAARLSVWISTLGDPNPPAWLSTNVNEATISNLLKVAWTENTSLATQLALRSHSPRVQAEIRWQLVNHPERALDEPEALQLLLGTSLPNDVSFQLKYLLYWAPVNPITAATYFLPAYGNHPFIIQYAMRALESHSVDITFFYVPQIVQTLRYDVLGYVERYIVETAKFSQLFAHQIIWNMKANAFKDEDSQIPDPVKPTLDKVMDALISSFSDEDKDFYEREFGFFNEVTSISGKLRPFIKRPKPEKKQKIEEELRKIQVDVGVYLPSNPDGVVIGIDRKSGKPLQSHAKAPFMATFRIRKERGMDIEQVEDDAQEAALDGKNGPKDNTYEVWQSAIFKVGDDCRQDVLSLQMIAAFRGIFNNVGLDVFVYPYRVTATAPGCGVIDVLPNSISRDMLGREAVNGLYEYWVSKYGTEDSLQFQAARNNFVKSMAAYSVISYLLQFKDRHNGNIMVDDAGHILHIDFGFIFDIAPGGVKFERAPFKLTSEMVAVMGGSTQAQPYKWFEELCIKAFLAARQHAEKLSHLVIVMLDSGLPCFKPETVQHFKERFVLDKTERGAAEFMRKLIHTSERSYSTGVYDQFQLLTNGIPY
ncbi:hypothetical protein AAFC00_003589 [Neodothiora populina]|uniref:1-phosphatidylinositol 4-kinase n=1 Tax=Neodothiora populina TaxID=2781224 RepID=A0ABR3PF30_9PEZI